MTNLPASDSESACRSLQMALHATAVLALDYISTDRFQHRQADPFDQQSELLGLQRDRRTISQALKEAGNGLSGLALGHQNPLPQTRRRT
nr:hypothetical protein [Burkholderia latens]